VIEDDSVLLSVRNLQTQFPTRNGVVHAVDGVSFSLRTGEMLGIVGESGCGKSITGLSILGLVPRPGRITSGQVIFDGRDLCVLPKNEMRSIRGSKIAMIFQDPLAALNPVLSISRQVTEAIRAHRGMSAREAKERAVELLKRVGIPSPEKRIRDYPHQFSGGMRQRVIIASAISCTPQILIADEPTTALDVTVQAQILELMRTVCEESGTSIMLITHSLGIVAGMCREVAVMYAGRIVERGETRKIFANPRHPYTHGLLASTPRMDRVQEKLQPIGGQPPSLVEPPARCQFAPRCRYAIERCWLEIPLLEQVEDLEGSSTAFSSGGARPAASGGHAAACFRRAQDLW
jgi:oligopeptide transport system ATP-binding protein